MSDLNDPRVLFAAERTLMAWSRTAAGLMALGFLIDRSEMLMPDGEPASRAGLWLGLAFVLIGVALSGLAVRQFRRAVADLRPVEIPPGYWVNLSVFATVALGALGLALALYLLAN